MSSVLITGASRGIGRLTAAELAGRGHRVVATARDPRALDDIDVDKRLRLDVTDQASVDAAIAEAGKIDVLLSNAGIMAMGSIEATPIAEVERMFDQNVTGGVRVTQAVLPQMRQRRVGRLVFVSSVLGRRPAWLRSLQRQQMGPRGPGRSPGVRAAAVRYRRRGGRTRPDPPGTPGEPAGLHAARRPLRPDQPHHTGNHQHTEQVAQALADLVEAPSVPLRAPIGAFTEFVAQARGSAPWDKPFALG